MKKIILFVACLLCTWSLSAQTPIPILQARSLSEGATVTVKGLVLNDSELGSIRYIQDETAAVGIYDTNADDAINIGDSVVVTGTLTLYNNLLEITNVGSNYTVVNSNNPLPEPIAMPLTTGYSEAYEGRLMRFTNVSFSSTGNFGVASSNYNITDGTTTAQVRVNATSNLAGTPIPVGNINIVGIMSQFSASAANTGYQLLPRSLNDIEFPGTPPVLTTTLNQTNLTQTGFTVGFETQLPGTTIIAWGTSPSDLNQSITLDPLTTSHSATLTNLQAGTIYYVQATSVGASGDQSVSAIQPMATVSASSGSIKAYFVKPVDTEVSSGVNAIYLNQKLPDTLKAYLNRAQQSIDICLYSYDNDNGITQALQAAVDRGVNVRIVGDSQIDAALWNALPASVKVKRPAALNGIMHNKFLVIDANASNPNLPIVWTGSTNYTGNQLTVDANNVVIFQDQSLARAFTIEFEEMAIGNKFSSDKADNTPKEFLVGGKRVELYFSPTDPVNDAIQRTARAAQDNLYFGILSFTRTDIAYAIKDAKEDGAEVYGIMDDDSNPDAQTVHEILNAPLGDDLVIDNNGYIFHHKYLISDPHTPNSDPMVLTGSHNWSSGAQFRNDENTVVVHDATLANIFYQEWHKRWTTLGMVYVPEVLNMTANFNLLPNPTTNVVYLLVQHNTHNATNTPFVVRNLLGEVVYQGKLTGEQASIPVSNWAKGVYFVELNNEVKRLVVQ